MMNKRVLTALCLILSALCLAGCGKKDPYEGVPNPTATILLEDGRSMQFELMLKNAPNTVANFVELANAGFYDGMSFYRVMPGCLIQTGDPALIGKEPLTYTIKGEFSANDVKNSLSHTRGTVSMARVQDDKNSADSQFFIMQGSYLEYDGDYAAFGRMTDEASLTVLDSIANVTVDRHYSPLVATVIHSIRVDTKGYEYEAQKIEKPEEE